MVGAPGLRWQAVTAEQQAPVKLPAARASKRDMLRLDTTATPNPSNPGNGDAYGRQGPKGPPLLVVLTRWYSPAPRLTVLLSEQVQEVPTSALPMLVAAMGLQPIGVLREMSTTPDPVERLHAHAVPCGETARRLLGHEASRFTGKASIICAASVPAAPNVFLAHNADNTGVRMWRWSLIKPPGSTAVLEPSALQSTTLFVADTPGSYVLELQVNEGLQEAGQVHRVKLTVPAKVVPRPADFDIHAALRTFGPALRKLREAHGIHLGELARALGCSGPTLSALELDKDVQPLGDIQACYGMITLNGVTQSFVPGDHLVIRDGELVVNPATPRGSTADWHRSPAGMEPGEVIDAEFADDANDKAAAALISKLSDACTVAADALDDEFGKLWERNVPHPRTVVAATLEQVRDALRVAAAGPIATEATALEEARQRILALERRVATLELAIGEAQGCCDAAVYLDSDDERGEAVARAAGILLDALKAPDQPKDPLRVRIAELEAEVAQLREALAEKRQKLRDQTPVVFLGKPVMVHSEVLLDPAAKDVFTGKSSDKSLYWLDLEQTIAQMLDTHQAVQGRAIELEKAVQTAMDRITDAFEEDNRGQAEDHVGLAMDALRRAL